jgi:hypothetical protein
VQGHGGTYHLVGPSSRSRAKYRVSAEERKRRTRRLILLGAWTERRMKDNPETQRRVLEGLDADLERNQDRELFDLEPREQQA